MWVLPRSRDVGLPRLQPAVGLSSLLWRGLRLGLLRGPKRPTGPFFCGETIELFEPPQSSSSSKEEQSGSPTPKEDTLRRSQ